MTNPEQERSAEELMRELDRDSMTRLLTGRRKRVVDIAFIAYAVIMMVMTLVVSGATPYTRQPLFLGLTLCIGYLKYPATKKMGNRENYLPWYDIALAVLSLLTYGYYVVNQNNIILMAQRIGLTEIIIGLIALALLVELVRRAVGLPIICVAGAFVVYAVIWLVQSNPYTALRNLVYNLFYNLNCGVFSTPVTVCASFIILFIILGSFLEKRASAGSSLTWRTRWRARRSAARRRWRSFRARWKACTPARRLPTPSAADR